MWRSTLPCSMLGHVAQHRATRQLIVEARRVCECVRRAARCSIAQAKPHGGGQGAGGGEYYKFLHGILLLAGYELSLS